MTDQTTTPAPTDAPASAPAAQLQLQDLMLAAQVIQLASQRGAIRAEEMSQVGGVYERIVAFLQSSGALQPAQTPAAPTAPATPAAPAAQ